MKTSTPTPTPRPALKATGMRRRHARCLETELAALTAERDQLRAEVKSCGELSCDECNARTAALMVERDQLRAALALGQINCDAEYDNLRDERDAARARAERAEAEVERLGHLEAVLRSCAFDKDGTAWKTVCGWWSKKYDAVERQMSENATRAERAEAELAAEREESERYRLATLKLDAGLAIERARLDHLSARGFEHRHHETGDHLGYEWTISSYSESEGVTLRDVIDAEMREEAK